LLQVSTLSSLEKPKEKLTENEYVRESLLESGIFNESTSKEISPQLTEKIKSLTTTV